MALSILILCIASMISFNPVTSSNSSKLSSHSAPPLDFEFSQLIDDLVRASDNSSNSQAMLAIFHEVEDQLELLTGEDKSLDEVSRPRRMDYSPESKVLAPYVESARGIDQLYGWLKSSLMDKEPNEKWLNELVDQFISPRSRSPAVKTLSAMLQRFELTFSNQTKNFMSLLIEITNTKAGGDACSYKKQSRQYEIYEIYHKLVITTVKAYVMRIYGYMMRGNYTMKEFERTKYRQILDVFQKSAMPAIANASKEIISCDGRKRGDGPKYIELKWLFNTIVTNEAYLNKDASCWYPCTDYQNTTFYQYTPEPLDELNICHGRIYNCIQQTVNSYCPATDDSRRFDGLLPEKMGKTSCSQKHDISNKVSNGGFNVCSQCICYCDDYNRSDTVRKFSLRPVESDTSKNKVITGIQFVEKNGTIYLRIQEGELGVDGTIEESTVEWQPINEIDWKSPFITEYDYVTITYDTKIVNLDTLVASPGRVLTGIQFHTLGTHLALKIKSHDYDHEIGILGIKTGFWESYRPLPRQEIMMTAPDNPAYMNQSVIDTRKDTYVTFRMTDLEKDAGQTAIPFIDAQPVVSNPPVPLSGAGIYFRGQPGYGGFIGLKTVTYDFAKVIGK